MNTPRLATEAVPLLKTIRGRRIVNSTRSFNFYVISRRLRCLSTTTTASSATASRSTGEIPTFKVTKVFFDGKQETLYLQPSDLLKSASIYARDLFNTLNLTSRQERKTGLVASAVPRRAIPVIIPRQDSILVNFGNIRAVVQTDAVLLMDAHSAYVKHFALELQEIFQSSHLPSMLIHDDIQEPDELIFLEHVLKDAVKSFNRRLRLYEPIVDSFLDKVASEVMEDSTGAHLLVPLKDALQSFEIQVQQSFQCLTDLLNNDEEMLDLLLTEQAEARMTNQEVAFDRHEQVELLLGVYARQLSNSLYEIRYLLNRLQSKQEFVSLALAGYRNRLVRMNVNLGIGALSLGLGTTVAGFFGMNLINGLETSPTAFLSVVTMCSVTSTCVAMGSLSYLNGRTLHERAEQRLDEIETLTSALSDMCALDFTIKTTLDNRQSLNKEEFKSVLRRARQSKQVSSKEVDLLFNVFDTVQDGYISEEDFEKHQFLFRTDEKVPDGGGDDDAEDDEKESVAGEKQK